MVKDIQYKALIDHIRRYVSLSDRDVDDILDHFEYKTAKSKSYIIEQGTACKFLYFVYKGCLRLFYNNNKGLEQTLQFAIEGWWITDYDSFLYKKKTEYNIQATEKSIILFVERQKYDHLLQKIPVLETYFRIMAQRALAAYQLRFRLISELSKEDMFLNFSLDFPDFVQRIPQYMLASYLGLTPEYLSEIRRKSLSLNIKK